MKHLTPERYIRINEASDTEAEQAYKDWEAAGTAARSRFLQIKHQLPPQLVELFESRCLHDAEVLSINVSGQDDGSDTLVAVINIRQGHDVIGLVYDLLEHPKRKTPAPSQVFVAGATRVSWLYDEIELVNEAEFVHEILLNTGEVLELRFFQFGMFIYHSAHAVLSSAG